MTNNLKLVYEGYVEEVGCDLYVSFMGRLTIQLPSQKRLLKEIVHVLDNYKAGLCVFILRLEIHK